ncbi:MAG: hypothetical protein IAF94_22660 [Pirellulaceae bacterium]|nr:hypothetical protein [Pirellulaceae bacterium]
MTVHSRGFHWWQRLVDRYQVQMFRRVTKVYLHGPQYKSDLLPELAKLHDLEELALNESSIPSKNLEVWKMQHPRVVVTATRHALTR